MRYQLERFIRLGHIQWTAILVFCCFTNCFQTTHYSQMDYETTARQFIQEYYKIFQQNSAQQRANSLGRVLEDDSRMSIDGEMRTGRGEIKSLVTEKMNYKECQHYIETIYSQPSGSGIFVLVSGMVMMENGQAVTFSQAFFLKPREHEFYIANNILKLFL